MRLQYDIRPIPQLSWAELRQFTDRMEQVAEQHLQLDPKEHNNDQVLQPDI